MVLLLQESLSLSLSLCLSLRVSKWTRGMGVDTQGGGGGGGGGGYRRSSVLLGETVQPARARHVPLKSR